MAVLVRISATGLDEATYDQISAGLTSLIPEQPGFLMHVAYPVPGGFAVGEVWETQAQQEAWYNGFVLPNLPDPDAMSTEYIELHNVIQP